MAKFELPEVTKDPESIENQAIAVEPDYEWLRRVRLPANEAIVNELSVGEDVEVVLKGTVLALSYRDSEKRKEGDLELDVAMIVTKKAGNEFSELAEDDDDE